MAKTILWSAIVFLTMILYAQSRTLHEVKQKLDIAKKSYDSLRQEQFPLEVELSRYENTLEILEEEVPGLAHEFRRIMSERTE